MKRISRSRQLRFTAMIAALALAAAAPAQDLNVYRGTQVPPAVERIYERGLQFLVASQNEDGSFTGNYGTEPATAALALMAFLAHGDDPNHGPYAKPLKRCLEFVLGKADEKTGYLGSSMYNHGFCTLALAEAYGAMQDERIGPALKRGVELILTSQEKNRFKAWRYGPDAQDADSTVSGACFVALVAARNAGLRVPDNAIEGALKFYTDCLSPRDGSIGYMPGSGSHGGGSTTAIGVAVYAYARKKDAPTFTKAFKALQGIDQDTGGSYPFYFEYYASQAMFQADVKAWETWNEKRVKQLTESQNEDGSWDGMGSGITTSFGLLSIALNYRYLPIYER